MTTSQKKRSLAEVREVAAEEWVGGYPPLKKKSDGSFAVCATEACKRPVDAGTTKCCDLCAADQTHDCGCDVRNYRCQVFEGKAKRMETAEDLNRRLKEVTDETIGSALRMALPKSFSQISGLVSVVLEYCTPQLEIRPVWDYSTEKKLSSLSASKCGGRPQLLLSEEWPRCKSCGELMPLYMQLVFSDLPADFAKNALPKGHKEFLSDKLFQLFFCNICDEGYEAFSDGQLARVVSLVTDKRLLRDEEYCDAILAQLREDDINAADEVAIGGWKKRAQSKWEVACVGYFEATEALECECAEESEEIVETRWRRGDAELWKLSLDSECLGAGFLCVADELHPAEDNKLGGFPAWIFERQYADCPQCGNEMNAFVLQYDAQCIGEGFSDCGIGYLTLCPIHPTVVAFSTQSS